MNYPHNAGKAASARLVSRVATAQWTAKRSGVVPVSQPEYPTRRYEALGLLPDGSLTEVSRRAPAHPVFEAAFAAIARGTLMATLEGPVAIEDLVPGVKVETRDAGYQTLLWVGSITLTPHMAPGHGASRLFRIPLDSFGPQRPMPDLMLAPHARLLHRTPKLRNLVDDESALTPISAFEDGFSVIRVAPVSPVNVYHVAFQDHHILRANGLEIESFHPGPDLVGRIGSENMRVFQSFFPHIRSIGDFGPLVAPHITAREFEELGAA